jgi:hypothetical protein
MSVRRLLGLAFALGALAAPSVAHAADTTITFNGLATNTEIRDQYADQGVLFGPASAFAFGPVYDDCLPGKAFAFGNQLQFGRCGGSNEFKFFATMGGFNSPRGHLRMRLSSPTTPSSPEDSTLKVYNYQKALLTSVTVPDTAEGRIMDIVRGTPDIYYFTLERNGIGNDPPTVDDFTFDNPPVPPEPHIGFGIDDPGTSHLRQGGSTDISLRILRLGGSNGAVNLTVANLPAGVTGTITPNPATGSAFLTKATLHLTAASNASLQHFIPKVTATPTPSAGDAPADVTFGLDVVVPFQLTLQDTHPSVAPCSPSSIPMRLDVEPSFTDPISLTVTRSNDSVKADLPATFTPGFGTPPTSIPVSGDTKTNASTTLTVTARSGSFSASGSVTVGRSTGAVTDILITPGGGRVTNALAPQMNRPGSYLRLDGRGLCPNQTVKFGGGDSVGAPLESVAPDGSHGFVRVPITATSGPVTVSGPDGDLTSTRPLDIITFRNTFGFPFVNFNSAGPAWEDMVKLYGTDKTNVRVNVCKDLSFGLLSCGVTTFVPRAEVLIYFAGQTDLGEGGNCYGLNLAAYRLWSGGRALSDFSPAGATTPFGLDAAAGPAAALRAYVRLMMIAQTSSEVLKLRTVVGTQSAGTMYQVIYGALAQGHPVMMSLKGNDGTGHSVVAYGLTPTTKGYDVEVYNPNDPHMPNDDTDSGVHDANLERSRVHVNANNTWSFSELNYGGGFDKIGAYDISRTPQSLSPPVGLDDLLVAIGIDAAAPTGPGGKPIDGAVRLPAETGGKAGPVTDVIPRGEAIDTSLAGVSGTVALLGKDHAFQVAGTGKTLTLDAAGEVVGVRGAGKNLRLTTTSTSGSTVRSAAATFPGGGDDAIGFGTASALTVKGGAAGGAVSLTLGQVGPQGAGSMTVTGLRLRGGETATVRPASWTTPGAVSVSIRGKGGKVRKLTLRGRAAKALATVTALKAKAKGGLVTVTAKAKLPAGGVPASGNLVWQARRGRSTHVARKGTVALTPAQLAAAARGKPLTFRVSAPKGIYKVKVALIIGSTTKGGVLPALADRKANVTVKLA